MDNKKIVTVGENLKNIRKKLGFRQYEIVGNEITRNLVSLIENNKVSLNKNTAKILVDNMNKLAKERNLGIDIEEKDLFIPGRFEAKLIANSYIEKLEKNDTDNINKLIDEINQFLSKWDLPHKKAIIYSKIANYYYHEKELLKSYAYYIRAFENSIKLSDHKLLANLIILIIKTCIRLKKYDEAINYSNILHIYNDKVPQELLIKILFNRALAYLYLSKYEKCLEEISYIETKIDSIKFDKYIDLMILKAVCYKRRSMYNEALSIYDMLYEKLTDKNNRLNNNFIESRLMILLNKIEIYRLMKNNPKVIELLEWAVFLLNKINHNTVYSARFYLEIAYTYKYLNKTDFAEEYLIRALCYAKKIKDLNIINEILHLLVEIYISKKSERINSIRNEILDLMKQDLLKQNNSLILQIMDYYLETKQCEELNKTIKQLLKIENRKLQN